MNPKTDAGEPVEGATVVIVLTWNPP
jgi:hypothetical protein